MRKKRFVIIDVHALIHRAYHAYPLSLTFNNKPINAVYGFSVLLLDILKKFSPDYLVACADFGKAEKRLEIFKDYKATRKPTDKELLEQIPIIYEIIDAFNILLLKKKGYEADDLIGTIVSKIKNNKNLEIIIVTGDKDLFQLVDSNVFVYLAGTKFNKSRLFNEDDVQEKIGVGPDFVIDYKAIRGDPSDNIPGVRGIGDKGAIKLIKEFGHLSNIIKNVENIKENRLKKALASNLDNAKLSYKLAQIDTNVNIKMTIGMAKFIYDLEKIIAVFAKYNFNSLIKKIEKMFNIKKENILKSGQTSLFQINDRLDKEKSINPNYVLVKNDNVNKYLTMLENSKEFAFDTETTSLDVLHNRLVGISFSIEEAKAFFIPVEIINNSKKVKERINKIFENKSIQKIGHNIKFDLHALKNSKINVNGIYFDTMLAAYLFGFSRERLSLKWLAKYFLKINDVETYSDLTFLESDLTRINQRKLSQYACADADFTYRLFVKFFNDFEKNENLNLKKLFFDIEMPLINVLLIMERTGIKLSRKKVSELSKILDEKLLNLKQKIYKLAGIEFNISSNKQLSEILFLKLGLVSTKKTPKGASSTSEQALIDIRDQHEIIDLILDYRQYFKLRTTYTDSLLQKIDKKTKRIHTSFNQMVTATGRLSSSNPNLQNIPISSDFGKKIRSCFVPEKRSLFVSFDYSQQELRILASVSKDKTLLESYQKDLDIHKLTASKLLNKKIDNVNAKERTMGKVVNFSIIYGISAYGLANRLKIPTHTAKEFIDNYFKIYPAVKIYFDELLENVYEKGRVETLYGRRKYIDRALLKNYRIKSRLYREIINFPIQGGAADMMKLAMVNVYNKVLSRDKYGDIKILLQIHDELLFELPEKNSDFYKEFFDEIIEEMLSANKYDVKMRVDIGIGNDWGNIKEIKY